jgi:hypothetical protein
MAHPRRADFDRSMIIQYELKIGCSQSLEPKGA